MRNISFALTTAQIRNRTKRVTRRIGWQNLKVGDHLQACVKCQGLKPGEHPIKLAEILVVNVRREPLARMFDEPYGTSEAKLEGFPHLTGEGFARMFAEEMQCFFGADVTRIEFEYLH